MSEVTDDELLLMFREGDTAAFDALFDRYHAAVYNFARAMLGGADGAEEVMQESFLAVIRAARDYKPRGHFRSWLMRIVRNKCLNRLRRQERRRALPGGLDFVQPEAETRPPAEELEESERLAAARRQIENLPERQREAIVLYAFERMKYREIADVLGTPIGTVKTLIHRARARLAAAMEAETGKQE